MTKLGKLIYALQTAIISGFFKRVNSSERPGKERGGGFVNHILDWVRKRDGEWKEMMDFLAFSGTLSI